MNFSNLKIKGQIRQINSLILLSFKLTFKSFRVFAYSFLFPIILFSSAYLISTSFGSINKIDSYSRILGLLSIGPIFSLFTTSFLIITWRESIFIKQINIIKINKYQIFTALFFIILIFSLMSYLLLIICGCIIDVFLINKNFINAIKEIDNFTQIIGIFFTLILYSILIFSIGFLTSYLLNSPVLTQTINLILIILILFLGDVVFDINVVTNIKFNLAYEILGYFIPTKSFQWLLFVSYSDILTNQLNFYYIISNAYAIYPFTFGTQNINYIFIFSFISSLSWLIFFGILLEFVNIKKNKLY